MGIRVATAALSGRIFAGHPTKDGRGFKEPRHDVTNDVYQAIRDHIGIGHQITLHREGEPSFTIALLPADGALERHEQPVTGSYSEPKPSFDTTPGGEER